MCRPIVFRFFFFGSFLIDLANNLFRWVERTEYGVRTVGGVESGGTLSAGYCFC